jgi:hypothetical protein
MFLTLVIKINGIPKDDAAENGMGEIRRCSPGKLLAVQAHAERNRFRMSAML